jgi:hypothetical protein
MGFKKKINAAVVEAGLDPNVSHTPAEIAEALAFKKAAEELEAQLATLPKKKIKKEAAESETPNPPAEPLEPEVNLNEPEPLNPEPVLEKKYEPSSSKEDTKSKGRKEKK